MLPEAELVVDCRCALGESVLWDARRKALLWTDIHQSQLWMHGPIAGQSVEEGSMNRTPTGRYWPLPDRLGCFAFCESGQLLLGLAKGLYLAELDLNADAPPVLTLLWPVEAQETRTRINDGRCDRAGNFVFGTLNEDRAREPIGSFYQYSARHGLRRLELGGVAIPNSICFSPDGGTLYYCDTTRPRILCCDYDAESAAVAHCRVFATLSQTGGADGSTIDADGCLWNAQWGSSYVVRYTPQGEIERIVRVPTKNPSCVAFGGANLDQLYISSARDELSQEELEAAPHAGGIYGWHEASLRGLPENLVKLT